jgi:hypothetical protein
MLKLTIVLVSFLVSSLASASGGNRLPTCTGEEPRAKAQSIHEDHHLKQKSRHTRNFSKSMSLSQKLQNLLLMPEYSRVAPVSKAKTAAQRTSRNITAPASATYGMEQMVHAT